MSVFGMEVTEAELKEWEEFIAFAGRGVNNKPTFQVFINQGRLTNKALELSAQGVDGDEFAKALDAEMEVILLEGGQR